MGGIVGLDDVESLRDWEDMADRDRREMIVSAIFVLKLRHDIAVAFTALGHTLLLHFGVTVAPGLEEGAWAYCNVIYPGSEL